MVIIRFPTVLIVHFSGHTSFYVIIRAGEANYEVRVGDNLSSGYVACATFSFELGSTEGLAKAKVKALAELDRIEAELREYHING